MEGQGLYLQQQIFPYKIVYWVEMRIKSLLTHCLVLNAFPSLLSYVGYVYWIHTISILFVLYSLLYSSYRWRSNKTSFWRDILNEKTLISSRPRKSFFTFLLKKNNEKSWRKNVKIELSLRYLLGKSFTSNFN